MKKYNKISGELLTRGQMNEVIAGLVFGGTNKCESSVCPIKASINCLPEKIGDGCACEGVGTRWEQKETDRVVQVPKQ